MAPHSSPIHVRPASWGADEDAIRAVRERVFIDEQGVPENVDFDGSDAEAGWRHFLAWTVADEIPIGTARMHREDGRVGRMAVLASHRSAGVGRALVEAILAQARADGLRELHLHGQTAVTGFYANFGFVAEGPEFFEAGIPHRLMRAVL